MPTRLLRISSKDRAIQSSSKYDFTFPTNDYDLHQVNQIMLKSAIIPNTQYNINTNNNSFVYRIAGVLQTPIVFPVGQYELDSFIVGFNELSTVIGMTLVQNTLTKKLQFTTTTAIEYLTIELNPIARVLGIHTTSDGDVLTHNADGLPDLIGLRHLYISSSALSNNTSMITEDKQKINVFADIPIDVPFGGLQIVDNNSRTLDYSYFNSHKNISSIDIKLLDEYNNLVDLNGHDFILVLHIS